MFKRIPLFILSLACVVTAQTVVPKPASTKAKPALHATPPPKPQPTDLDESGKPKYATYEDYIEDLVAWKMQQSHVNASVASKPKTLASCRAQLADALNARDTAVDDARVTSKELENQKQKNAELQKKYDDAVAVLVVLKHESAGEPVGDDLQKRLAQVASGEVLESGVSIESEQKKLVGFAVKLMEHDSLAVEKCNALLADYKDYVQRVGIQLAQIGQANRVNNALAIYQMMPRYTPPQTINLQVTDCTRLPALCVH